MKLSEFDYDLPADRIAQHPLKKRDASKLLVLHRKAGGIEHRVFKDIVDYRIQSFILYLHPQWFWR